MAFVWIAACRITAVQRRLITTPAEAPNLLPFSSALTPTLIGLKTLYPEFGLLPWCYVYGKPGTMATSGTGQTTAAGSPYSKKDLKGNCTAGNAPEQHQELGD